MAGYLIARVQIRQNQSNAVGTHRQVWIDSLREEVATIVARMLEEATVKSRGDHRGGRLLPGVQRH